MSDKKVNLAGGQRLALNILWNFVGGGAPLLVAFITIPILIEGFGTARFGVLTLAWMVVGYFSLFDMGLGRALTKLVAEKIGKGQYEEIPSLIWTAILLMAILGVLGTVVSTTLSPWLVSDILKIPLELQSETLMAFYLLGVSIPIVISTIGLRGILEAYQRFGLVNAVRIPLGILTFLGPALVLPYSNSLVSVIMVLVFCRLASWCVYVILCLSVVPSLRESIGINYHLMKTLITFGGWMTVTNVVGPLMVYLDRFFIGTMAPIAAIAYYTTPYEVITKLRIVPTSLMGVLFPAFATMFGQDHISTTRLFIRAVNYIFLFLFPIIIIVVVFAHEGMTLWLGSEFADKSYIILQLLAIGVFINCHAHIPFGLVQSAGRPDITAKLHLIELPFYLLLLWWLLSTYGIVGAAVAWVVRVVIDTILLFYMAHRFLSVKSPFILRPIFKLCIGLLILVFCTMIPGIIMKGLFLIFGLPIFVVTSWCFIFEEDERNVIRNYFKTIHIFSQKNV